MIALFAGMIYWNHRSFHREHKTKNGAQPQVPANVVFADEAQMKNLTIEPVVARDFIVDRELTGKVGFNEDRLTPVFTAYPGRVVAVLADKGAAVSKGQSLLTIESPDYVAAQTDLTTARADVEKATINLKAAQINLERSRKLFAQDAIPKKDLQNSESAVALAEGELQRAKAALSVAESRLVLFGKSPADVSKLKAGVDRDLNVPAPIAGTVVERQVGLGQIVRPDAPTPLFQISDLSLLWAQADVFESDLANIRLGEPAEIRVETYPNRIFPGRLSFINPTVDPTTRTVHVRCLVDNSAGLLKPDMFARIKIIAAARLSVPVIPATAIVERGEKAVVLVEEAPGRFRKRQVEIGDEVNGNVVVNSGLKVGERIVTKGAILLV
jgi:cobalt-zinc-cadmium efflux system membrane fusion protein